MTKLDRVTPEALRANPRATLSAWQKYEQIVQAAMSVHPKPYVYPCTSLKPATICSRLRDAVRGKIAFDYPSVLQTNDVARWFSEVIFKYDLENVYIGPMDKVKEVLDGSGMMQGEKALSFPTLSFEQIAAFAILLSTQCIQGPVHIHQPPLDISLLPERPNLEMITRKDGSLVLI